MVKEHYRHTQFSYWLPSLTALALAVLAMVMFLWDEPWLFALVLAAGIATPLIFGKLTVVVDAQAIRFWFGWSWPRGSFALSEVSDARTVRNSWLYGWGIHWYPGGAIRWYAGGWVFNVAGRDAVELTMKSGRRYRIGTDEPERLETAIKNALKRI